MIPAAVVFIYLGVVLAIGLVARGVSAGQPDAEDCFLAGTLTQPRRVSAVAVRRQHDVFSSGTMVLGLLPLVPMTLISALLMVVVSRSTPDSRPAAATLTRYF